ncbi:hypothetical protein AERO9A_300128 [Aeromonas salmonicida]|nr:hypothetical protein AERO9A_300128 [Aeromonas salmonicida]
MFVLLSQRVALFIIGKVVKVIG